MITANMRGQKGSVTAMVGEDTPKNIGKRRDRFSRVLRIDLAETKLEAKLQSANLLCKDALSKLVNLGDAEKGHESVDSSGSIGGSHHSLIEACEMMARLDRILDELRIAVASCNEDSSGDDSSGDDDDDEGGDETVVVKYRTIEPVYGYGDQSGRKSESAEKLQLSDELRDAKDKMEKEITVVKDELTRKEKELTEGKRVAMDLEAQLLEAKSRYAEEKLAQCNEKEESLREVEKELDGWKRAATEEKAKRTETEEELRRAAGEVGKLQKAIADLTIKLAEQKKEYEEACEALNQKLQG
jgi:hypothetical protein